MGLCRGKGCVDSESSLAQTAGQQSRPRHINEFLDVISLSTAIVIGGSLSQLGDLAAGRADDAPCRQLNVGAFSERDAFLSLQRRII
jgi:hypothetical protein